MLEHLSIRNLAIIENLNVQFSPGLNVITGETGAGKSIIINAIKLLMGERAKAEIVRHGTKQAEITAFFSGDNPNWKLRLEDMGIEVEDEGELIVKRIINRNGKNKIFINGQLITLQMLQQVVSPLITLSGQHEYQKLLQPQYQLEVLDIFANLSEEKRRWQEIYQRFLNLRDQKELLWEKIEKQVERKKLLEFQIKEIEDAQLSVGEEEKLKEQRLVLQNIVLLKEIAHRSYWQLYEDERAVIASLTQIKRDMERASEYDPKWSEWANALQSSLYLLEDLAQSLRDYQEGLSFDPHLLEAIETRLDRIIHLKKKYHVETIKELLELKENFVEELEDNANLEMQIKRLQKELDKIQLEMVELVRELSIKRKKAASILKERIENYLHELGMEHAQANVEILPLRRGISLNDLFVDENGAEEVNFQFSANLGEPPKSLHKIASGGELARFLLALKSILGDKSMTETIIFDEIDTGVGGDIGSLIGKRLKDLAKQHQIICITHLPQIACYAENHFKVEKKISDGRTVVTIYLLDKKSRTKEIIRMLGNKPSSKTYAEALLNQAAHFNK